MEYRVTTVGIEIDGTPTPWSEISSIMLVREPAVVHGGMTISEAHRLIVIELVTGDFVEIAEGTPRWGVLVDELPRFLPLLVDDLPALVASGHPGEALLWRQTASGLAHGDLATQIRARRLPESVVTIAVRGGAELHPALEYRAESVEPSPRGPAWAVVNTSGRDDLVPLWTCGTVSVFSAADGSFLEWDAEQDEPWTTWPDYAGVVRSLLTDLWEDDADDAERAAVARLLLPEHEVAAALVPEER